MAPQTFRRSSHSRGADRGNQAEGRGGNGLGLRRLRHWRNSPSKRDASQCAIRPSDRGRRSTATRRGFLPIVGTQTGEAAMPQQNIHTYLGLDIGTSSVKALLIDADQRVVAEATAPLNVSRPHPLWSEQDPDDWVEGVEAAVAAIRRDAPAGLAALAGIGLSGQMHGATLLGADDKPLRPAILWNDGRSFAECAELKRRVPDVEKRTGNLVMPGFTAPKFLWVAAHEPEIAKATKRVLLPKDYVRLRLSGEAVSEMSDASGTSWLDVGERRWDEALLAATGLSLAAMPRLVEGLGSLGASLAGDRQSLGPRGPQHSDRGRRRRQRRLGDRRRRDGARRRASCRSAPRASFSPSPTVSSACRSARCTPFATRCRSGGTACRSCCRPRRRSPGSPAFSAASTMIGALVAERRGLRAARRARSPPRRSSCPISAASARPTTTRRRPACSQGFAPRTAPDALVFAVMEGVAFSFADGVDVLDAAGARPVRPLLVGGGARSDFWGQMIADVTGLTIDLAAGRGGGRGARRGAARHARRRRRKGRGRVHAPAGRAHVHARPRARRAARAAARALPRALSGGESGAGPALNQGAGSAGEDPFLDCISCVN